MKRHLICILLTLVVATTLWYFWPVKPISLANEIRTNHSSTAIKLIEPESISKPIFAFSTNGENNNFVSPSTNSDYIKFFQEQRKLDRNFEWKMPINFWGKVVDENDAPVADAHVHFSWNVIADEKFWNGTDETNVVSDSNGLFSLLDRRGKRLSARASKEGYHTPKSEFFSFEYANPYDGLFIPKSNEPVVFHLRKKVETEPMIHGRQLYDFKTDGTPYYLDLLTGKKFTEKPVGWDLAISLIRSESNTEQKFNWTVKIETSGGGLIETNSDFMFPAPEAGYNNVELGQEASGPRWRSGATFSFFFKSRNKIYGQFKAGVYPKYRTNAAIDLNYYVNPSGSRNLEFDPAKEIKSGQ